MNAYYNDIVNRYELIREIDSSVFRDLLDSAELMEVPEGVLVASEKTAMNFLPFIISGNKRVYMLDSSGKELTLYEIGEGQICPLLILSLLSGKPYLANAVSLSRMQMAVVPRDSLLVAVQKHSIVREYLLGMAYNDVALLIELLSETAFTKMSDRLIEYLFRKSGDGTLETTHQKIANDLGTAREVISRLLKDLERKDLVKLSRNKIQLNERFYTAFL